MRADCCRLRAGAGPAIRSSRGQMAWSRTGSTGSGGLSKKTEESGWTGGRRGGEGVIGGKSVVFRRSLGYRANRFSSRPDPDGPMLEILYSEIFTTFQSVHRRFAPAIVNLSMTRNGEAWAIEPFFRHSARLVIVTERLARRMLFRVGQSSRKSFALPATGAYTFSLKICHRDRLSHHRKSRCDHGSLGRLDLGHMLSRSCAPRATRPRSIVSIRVPFPPGVVGVSGGRSGAFAPKPRARVCEG